MMTKTCNILLQLDSHNSTSIITPTHYKHEHKKVTQTSHKLTTHVSYDTQHILYNTKLL